MKVVTLNTMSEEADGALKTLAEARELIRTHGASTVVIGIKTERNTVWAKVYGSDMEALAVSSIIDRDIHDNLLDL